MKEWLNSVNVFQQYRKPSIRRKRRASDTTKSESKDKGVSSKSLHRLKPLILNDKSNQSYLNVDDRSEIDNKNIAEAVNGMASKVKNRISLPPPNKLSQKVVEFDSTAMEKIENSRKHDINFINLKRILDKPHNTTCADCRSPNPLWASVSLDLLPMVIFICINCSGWHRSLGSHISKVKSVELDDWTEDQIGLANDTGNFKCNLYWEAKRNFNNIPDSTHIGSFIISKYRDKIWVDKSKPFTI